MRTRPARLLALIAVLALGSPAALHAQEPPPRLEGEHGLWVEDRDSVVHVQWITRGGAPGFLEAAASGRRLYSATTPAGPVHAVSFPRPDNRRIMLEYGTAGDAGDRHRTELRLRAPRPGRVVHDAVDSLYIVGDVHGAYDNLIQLLRNAGLVDSAGGWSGGRAHLVLLGDLMDRGPDVTGLLWFVYRLEAEAERSGGRVHVLLGNHEVMVTVGDLRYVHPKEQELARRHGVGYSRLFDVRRSVLGRWIASKPALVRIGDVLLAHGGVADAGTGSVQAVADSLSKFIREDLFYHWTDTTVTVPMDSASYQRRYDFFWADNSVFWYRGYVQSDTLGGELQRVLHRLDARVHVVAHTPVQSIQERYGGSLIAAHPVMPATEMLLLARDGRELRRFRIRLFGPPEPLGGGGRAAEPER